jgi:16S rRNA C967 or C1407 C5-methylase (RsmB/RsmF family)
VLAIHQRPSAAWTPTAPQPPPFLAGTLVYSTCTVSPLENEGLVARIIERHPEMELVDATPRLGAPGLAGLGLSESQRVLVQRFDPGAAQGGDSIGFFVAKMLKREGS